MNEILYINPVSNKHAQYEYLKTVKVIDLVKGKQDKFDFNVSIVEKNDN